MKTPYLERKRSMCYFLIGALIVLNVLDAGFTGYSVLAYGLNVEQNPFAYLLIVSFGLVGFQLIKCVGASFVLLFAWFLIENISGKSTTYALIGLIGLYLYYVFIVVVGLISLPLGMF